MVGGTAPFFGPKKDGGMKMKGNILQGLRVYQPGGPLNFPTNEPIVTAAVELEGWS